MKKSTIKLTSALLMLSLMGTSVNASTPLDEDSAATRITKLIRLSVDRKLNQAFEALEQTSKNIKRDTVPGPTEADLEKSIASLNEHSDFKSMGLPSIFFLNAKDLDIRPFVGRYQRYIQSQIESRDPIRRQVASLIMAELAGKAAASEDKWGIMLSLLHETMNSDYPFFKCSSYLQLSRAAKDSGDKEQAFEYLNTALKTLPNRYHASIYNALAYFDDSEEYKHYQERCLKQIIEIGTPKEEAQILHNLAYLYGQSESNLAFYRPSEALDIYDSLLANPLVDADNVHIQMAAVLACTSDEKIKNVDRAVEILDSILLKELNGRNYSNATSGLVSILITKDPARALNLALEALSHPNLQEPHKSSIEKSLAYLYRHGPEDTRNHQEALRILEERAAATYGKDFDSSYRLYVLQSLASLLQYGDVTVKNVARAIQINEELRKDSKMKLASLMDLSFIYQYEAEHKNSVKCAECLNELVELYSDKPLEQLKALTRLLKIYTTEGAAFNVEATEATAQRILAHLAIDGTALLEVQVALSNLYNSHPKRSTPAEIIEINEAIAHNPMATSLDARDAHRRLIAAYLEQQNLEQVVTTYEHILTCTADVEYNNVVHDFIDFLGNPEYEAVQNPDRVAELIAHLFSDL